MMTTTQIDQTLTARARKTLSQRIAYLDAYIAEERNAVARAAMKQDRDHWHGILMQGHW